MPIRAASMLSFTFPCPNSCLTTSYDGLMQGRESVGASRGPIGGQNLSDFLVFFLFFDGILMRFWGFNYSQMANYRFLTDSTTFWMISGTSKTLSKSGPVALPIIIKLF